MRTISLWEPWGTAIAKGLKLIETRSWSTKYHGPLAIHCAKTRDHWAGMLCNPEAAPYFASVRVGGPAALSFGCVVAVCELVGVLTTEELLRRDLVSPQEKIFGNYEPGRFGWVLDNVRPLKTPLPFRGSQGFFEISDDLLVGR